MWMSRYTPIDTYIHAKRPACMLHTYSILYNTLTSEVGSVSTLNWDNANDCRFGWFTMKPQLPENSALNYAGVALCFIRSVERAEVNSHLNVKFTNWDMRHCVPLAGLTWLLPLLCLRFWISLCPAVSMIMLLKTPFKHRNNLSEDVYWENG